jgi:kynureninase
MKIYIEDIIGDEFCEMLIQDSISKNLKEVVSQTYDYTKKDKVIVVTINQDIDPEVIEKYIRKILRSINRRCYIEEAVISIIYNDNIDCMIRI